MKKIFFEGRTALRQLFIMDRDRLCVEEDGSISQLLLPLV